MHPLQELDVSAAAERIYLCLIEHGELTYPQLAVGEGTGEEELDAAVAELVDIGLVTREGHLLAACPPHLALESVAREHARKAALARSAAEELSQLWGRVSGCWPNLELLSSYDAAQPLIKRAQTDARSQVRAMTQGNLSSTGTHAVDGVFDALARGVGYEVIYSTEVLRDSATLHAVQQCVEAGEHARAVAKLPMNLTIVDDRWALVAARGLVASRSTVDAMVVHASPLLTALEGLFDAFWRTAVPITGSTEVSDATRETKRLLSCLSAGLTDESIAREFGVSERTVARRINRLQESLGAQTRFQLGVQASRQGWLGVVTQVELVASLVEIMAAS
jgi:DNA-binding NarL/FixJ family response regulator